MEQDIIKILDSIYNHYDPDNKPSEEQMIGMATDFAGEEESLYRKLYDAFDPTNRPTDDYFSSLVAETHNPYAQKKSLSGSELDGGSSESSSNLANAQIAANTTDYGFVWGKENEDELSQGSNFTIGQEGSKPTDDAIRYSQVIAPASLAYSQVKANRKRDYSKNGLDIAVQNDPKPEYTNERNRRLTPLERMIWSDSEEEDQSTISEYKYQFQSLQNDNNILSQSLPYLEERFKLQHGVEIDRVYELSDNLNYLQSEITRLQSLGEVPQNELDARMMEYNASKKEYDTYSSSEFIEERNGILEALDANYEKAKEMVADGKFNNVREYMEINRQSQALADYESNKGSTFEQIGNFSGDIAAKAIAKFSAGVGTILDSAEKVTVGDEKYTKFDRLTDYLADISDDTQAFYTTPTRYARPLVSKTRSFTMDGEMIEADEDSKGNLTFRDSKGNKVDVDVDEQKLKESEARTKFNAASLPYQFGQTFADLAVQLATTKGMSIPGQAAIRGLKSARLAKGLSNVNAYTSVTGATMISMSHDLYKSGLEAFDGDEEKAAKFALTTSASIGISSNLFGLEAAFAGGKGLLDDIGLSVATAARKAIGQTTVKDLSQIYTKNFITQGLGEFVEEEIIERFIENGVRSVMGAEIDNASLDEIASGAILSFASGGVMSGKKSRDDMNNLEKASLLFAAQNPESIKDEIIRQIESGQIVPEGEPETFATRQAIRFGKIKEQLDAVSDKISNDNEAMELAVMFDKRNDIANKVTALKTVEGLDALTEAAQERLNSVDEAINKYIGITPQENDVESNEAIRMTEELENEPNNFMEGEVEQDNEQEVEQDNEQEVKQEVEQESNQNNEQEQGANQKAEDQEKTAETQTVEDRETKGANTDESLKKDSGIELFGINLNEAAPKIMEKLDSFVKRFFTSKNKLNQFTFDKWIERKAEVAKDIKQAEINNNALKSAIREVYGTDTISKEIKDQIGAALQDKNLERGNVTIGGKKIDPRIQNALVKMRGHVDSMSKKFIDLGIIEDVPVEVSNKKIKGIEDLINAQAFKIDQYNEQIAKTKNPNSKTRARLEKTKSRAEKKMLSLEAERKKWERIKEHGSELKITIQDNLKSYLTTSYRVHSDKEWINKIQEDTAKWERGRDWYLGEQNKRMFALQTRKERSLGRMEDLIAHRDKQAEKLDAAKEKLAKAKIDDKKSPATITAMEKVIEKRTDRLSKINEKIPIYQEYTNKTVSDLDARITELDKYNSDMELVDRDLVDILQDQQENLGGDIKTRGAKIGSKDLGILKKKKDLDPALKEFLGEYTEADVNYMTTIAKQAYLIENQRFLESIREEGLDKGWLRPKGAHEKGMKRIAAESSKTMSPLNGLYAESSLAEAFNDFGKGDDLSVVMQKMAQFSFAVKTSKTVLSQVSQLRNYYFNYISTAVGNGYLANPIRYKNNLAKAHAVVGGVTFKSPKHADEYVMLTGLGVVGNTTGVQELKSLKDDSNFDYSKLDKIKEGWEGVKQATEYLAEKLGGQKSKRVVNKVMSTNALDVAQRLYGMSDEIHKASVFYMERENIAIASDIDMDTATPEQMEELNIRASKRANDIFQNYDMVSEGVQDLRRIPLFGSFVSFSYEVYRTQKNKLFLAVDQIHSDNKKEKKEGIIRAIGLFQEIFGYHAIAFAVNAGIGGLFQGEAFSDEDEDDVRRFARSWDKNASMIFLNRGDENHNMSYISGSSIVPSSAYFNSFNALFDENLGVDEKLSQFGYEMLDEFLGLDIGTQVILEAANYKNLETGKTLYETDAAVSPMDKAVSSAKHAFKAVQPAAWSQWKRFLNSFSEAHAELNYGGRLDTVEESVALFGGIRVTNLNIPQSLKFNAYKSSSVIQSINYPYKKAGKNKSAKLEELIERGVGVIEATKIINTLYGKDEEKAKKFASKRFPAEMEKLVSDYQFALRRGVPLDVIESSLKDAQLSNQLIAMIKDGDTSFENYLEAKKTSSKRKSNR